MLSHHKTEPRMLHISYFFLFRLRFTEYPWSFLIRCIGKSPASFSPSRCFVVEKWVPLGFGLFTFPISQNLSVRQCVYLFVRSVQSIQSNPIQRVGQSVSGSALVSLMTRLVSLDNARGFRRRRHRTSPWLRRLVDLHLDRSGFDVKACV